MKGKYVIVRDKKDCYTTDSIFWYCFFTNTPLPGDVKQLEKGTKTNWHTITHNGKVICQI